MSDGDETTDDETPETESADGEAATPDEEPAETEAGSEDEAAEEATERETTEEAATADEADSDADVDEADETDADDSGDETEAESEPDAEGEGESEDPDAEDEGESEDPDAEDEALETTVTEEDLDRRLDDAEEDLEAAETEADLDEVEAELDAIADDLERADLPEPEEGDEDEEETDPREEFEGRIETLRDALESQRGPYAEDVVSTVEDAKSQIADTRWTERGEGEVAEAVRSFTDDVSEILAGDFEPSGDDEAALTDALDDVAAAVADAGLDPDGDADTIDSLLETAEELESDLDDAQAWDDLETREKLKAQGYYDCLGHYKDFPPEWAALKEWEKRGNVEMVLLALDSFQSDFMEEHALHALTRMNDQGAFDEMHQRAQKRDKMAIEALGKMRAEDAVETLVEYVDADSDPALQKVTFKALGEIGDESATQALANKLDMDNDNLRPHAARALGILGDTRAVDPLADALENDEDEAIRAAAAWALRQIGTRRALEAAAEYTDERSYIVQHEAEKARDDLGADADTGTTSATGD